MGFSVGALLNGWATGDGYGGGDSPTMPTDPLSLLQGVASLFGPGYNTENGGEVMRQFPNPSLDQKSYIAWIKANDPVKWNSGRVWDNRDGSGHTKDWFMSACWSKITNAQALAGGIPVFDAQCNYVGNAPEGGGAVQVPAGSGRGAGVVSKLKGWMTEFPVYFWGAVAVVGGLVIWGLYLLFRPKYKPERKR